MSLKFYKIVLIKKDNILYSYDIEHHQFYKTRQKQLQLQSQSNELNTQPFT